jgi:hypothetical protein
VSLWFILLVLFLLLLVLVFSLLLLLIAVCLSYAALLSPFIPLLLFPFSLSRIADIESEKFLFPSLFVLFSHVCFVGYLSLGWVIIYWFDLVEQLHGNAWVFLISTK